MKTTNPNLPEPTLSENNMFSGIKSTLNLVSGVLKLAKKVFML